MKLNQERRLPMPLWLQGVLEFAQVAIISALLVLLPLLGVWFADGFSDRGFDSLARLAGHAWLLIHGVPLDLEIAVGASSADLITSVVSLTPLGLTLIPFFLAWRAGRRLARASYSDQLWQAGLGALATYAAVGAGTAFITETPEVSAALAASALIPLIPVGLGLIIGARREARSWGRLIGVDAAAWIAKTSQDSRWAGSYIWSVLRAAYLATVSTAGLAALLLTVAIGLHWAEIITVYEDLGPGVVGGSMLTVVALGLMPNFALWTFAWVTGAGFELGTGSSISPLGTDVGPLPAFPMFAALPTGDLAFGPAALLIPVVAGVLAGWWFLREGENHLGEWLEIKVKARWFTAMVSTLAVGVFVGILAGLFTAAVTWISHGSIGVGRFTEMGPDPLRAALWMAAEVATGVVLGSLLGPWLEREPRTTATQGTDGARPQ